MVGTGFGPSAVELGSNLSLASDLGTLSVAYRVTPNQWFWAQCTVPSVGMAGSLIALCLSVCCGLGCLGRYCGRRRSRRRQMRSTGTRTSTLATPILVYQPGGWRESTTR